MAVPMSRTLLARRLLIAPAWPGRPGGHRAAARPVDVGARCGRGRTGGHNGAMRAVIRR